MPSIWRPITLLLMSLLMVALAACAGSPTPPTPTVQRQAASASPQPSTSPVILSAGSGRGAVPAPPEAAGASAPALRLPSDGQQVVVVDSTDGQGVWVRRQPAGERLRVWPDGSPMLVVGEDRFLDGRTWRNVTTLDGQTGWVAAEFVLTADLSAPASLPNLSDPANPAPRTVAPVPPGVQARVVAGEATPVAPIATTNSTTAPRLLARAASAPIAAPVGQATLPTATTAPVAMTAPQPTVTPLPSATPIKAPLGARSIDVGPTTLALAGSERGLAIKIGTRPRDGMELLAVQVSVTNRDDTPFALYRGAFRLALSDRSRVEPLAGGTSPMPYSTEVEPGEKLEGSLTFEVPVGTRVDSLIWAPGRDVAYSLAVQ